MIDSPSTTHPSSKTRSLPIEADLEGRLCEDTLGHIHYEQDRGPDAVDGESADGDLGSVVLHPLPHGEDEQEGDDGKDQHDPGGVHPEPAGHTGLDHVFSLGRDHNHDPPPTRPKHRPTGVCSPEVW